VPVRVSEVVLLDGFIEIPAGRFPDAVDQLKGVQPPLVLMIPE